MANSKAKKFGTSLFGFKKADVNAYLERVIREFDKRLKELEAENSELKSQNNELRSKYEQLSQEADSIVKEKIKLLGYCCKHRKKQK